MQEGVRGRDRLPRESRELRKEGSTGARRAPDIGGEPWFPSYGASREASDKSSRPHHNGPTERWLIFVGRRLMSEDWLAGVGGVRLFIRRWTATQPIAAVLIVHGVGEHSGRYEPLAQALTRAGVAVFAYDLRGHGRSEGQRGHIDRFSDYLDDLDRAVAWTRGHRPCPLFLIGHSLGGLVVLHGTARTPALADGLILSSPACGLAVPVPGWQRALATLASAAWPALAMNRARVDSSYLSHDPAIGPAYVHDPLVHFRITARCYTEVVTRMRGAAAAAASVRWPALVFQAGDDHLVDANATRAMFERLASADKQLVRLEGWYHEVFNEVERARVIEQTLAWLHAHAAAH